LFTFIEASALAASPSNIVPADGALERAHGTVAGAVSVSASLRR
jgi:hypothetical protein